VRRPPKATARSRTGRRAMERPLAPAPDQFRLPATSLKVLVSFVPTVVMAPMITIAISEAIRPYSMAVAAESSRTKSFKIESNVRALLVQAAYAAGQH
jgi:hypothetical protein